MTEISIAEDLSAIEQLSAVAAREFASSCAQRVLPVIETIASSAATATATEALRWLEAPEVATRHEIERGVRALDEASIDDSNDPRYYAMRALGILIDAICASDAANAVVAAQSACEGMADLADDLDFILAAAGKETGVQVAERRAAESVLASLDSDESVAGGVDGASIGAAVLAFRRAAMCLSSGEDAGRPTTRLGLKQPTTHPLLRPSLRPSRIDRPAFRGERRRYWVQRARGLLGQDQLCLSKR